MRRSLLSLLLALATLVSCESSPSTRGRATPTRPPRAPASDPWSGYANEWTRLPSPPDERSGETWIWTARELVVAGGCDPEIDDGCRQTRTAAAFDPEIGSWRSLRPAPEPMADADAVWTGSRAIFLETYGTKGQVTGQTFDPETDRWRPLPDAPIRRADGAVLVWTGSEVIVWGGGDRPERRTRQGAAFDPTTDSWRRIADAPFGLNLASGVWTGHEMIVFGSLLDRRNRAATRTSVGAAYDPATDTWRELPASSLSPQATSAVLVDGRLVAWDYAVRWQAFGLARDRWSDPARMPLAPSECYPDSTDVGGLLFAWFCGKAALYDGIGWTRIHGGPLEDTIFSEAYERALQLWRFADLVPASSVVVMPMQGITLDHKGVACYGCAGSPTSYWVYRPPEIG